MPIMYVDDSGSPSHADQTYYFVLSGIIVCENKIKDLQKAVCDYKYANFVDDYVDSEIHAHGINKSTDDFAKIDYNTKSELLDNLYDMIKNIDCVGISILVNKKELQRKHPTWKVINTAWICLIKRYNDFLKENDMKMGRIRVDKSSSRVHENIIKVFNELIEQDASWQTIDRVLLPKFVDSSGVAGIQIADAFAYCTFQHKMQKRPFGRYWDIIYEKLYRQDSHVEGYGYQIYPK